MKRALYLVFAILFGSSAHHAIAQKPEDAIKYRQGVFRVIGWNFGSMAAMVKGKKPYNAEEFARNAEIVAFMSKLPLEGFTPGSETGKTKAKPEIWLEMDDFEAKLKKMQQEVDALAKVAKTGNFDNAKDQLGEVGQACKACHDKYRNK
ncbi:MAG: cytochrome c [Burkholderiales bacterium]|nr:cytochrome c [Burkholderiales bacterium]